MCTEFLIISTGLYPKLLYTIFPIWCGGFIGIFLLLGINTLDPTGDSIIFFDYTPITFYDTPITFYETTLFNIGF